MEKTLTFDDVLLAPAYSKVLPKDVCTKTRITERIELNIPVLSAAMDTVTESAAAIAMAREGGIGVIHKNMDLEEQAEEIAIVKRSESIVVKNPLTVSPEMELKELLALREQYGYSSYPVVKNNILAGMITKRDYRFESDFEKKVSELMSREVISVEREVSEKKAKKIMQRHRIEKLPIVDSNGRLKGLITGTDIEKREKYPQATVDRKGSLMVAGAISPKDFERAEALLSAGCDLLVIDTSHAHSKNVLNGLKELKKGFDCEVIAGNVATGKGAGELLKAGADAIKIGIGPGAICTTRIVSGVGVPQVTAIKECAEKIRGKVPLIADGGIKYSGDIAKAIASGADAVMLGSLLAGCDETPGKTVYINHRKFKQYRGMGSLEAMQKGSSERYMQAHVKEKNKLVPEGIEGIVPYRGSISETLYQLIGGLRSGMGLTGSKNIAELKKARVLQITSASVKESHPHSIKITGEAPNYP